MSCSTKVYLVGAGPGDLGLLTLRGKELVQRADCIVYDYLSNADILAFAKPEAECLYVGKKGFTGHVTQDQINELLVAKALELDAAWKQKAESADQRAEQGASGFPVLVRLKGGDPFVFGRGGEEAIALREAGVPFEVVPGVTSGIAAPAYAGIPVTHRGLASSVSFVTGNEDPTKNETALNWQALAGMSRMGGTLCFYMGMRNLPLISRKLIDLGVSEDTPVGLVQWGTTPQQRTVVSTLANAAADAADAGLQAPVMTVVGPVASLNKQLSWFQEAPLFGRRVVVTRSREQASLSTRELKDRGADVLEFPTIRIDDVEDHGIIDDAIQGGMNRFDWIVFTSANGVRRFMERLETVGAMKGDVREIGNARIACIGPATAREVEGFGLKANVVPGEYRAEAVFEAMASLGPLSGANVLIPRALEAREALPHLLAEAGANVTVAPVYRTVLPSDADKQAFIQALESNTVDAVTFTSSSTARNLAALLGDRAHGLLDGVDLFSIGPVTTETLANLGFCQVMQADEYTIPGLVRLIENTYTNQLR